MVYDDKLLDIIHEEHVELMTEMTGLSSQPIFYADFTFLLPVNYLFDYSHPQPRIIIQLASSQK